MACPYFIPTEVLGGDLFIHRSRLPLGDGYTGICCAPGHCATPSEDELRQFCNIGYPTAYSSKCPHFPANSDWDSVRLGVSREHDGVINVAYVCERHYLPAAHGNLQYDRRAVAWKSRHADERIQSKADVYILNWIAYHPQR